MSSFDTSMYCSVVCVCVCVCCKRCDGERVEEDRNKN